MIVEKLAINPYAVAHVEKVKTPARAHARLWYPFVAPLVCWWRLIRIIRIEIV